MGNTIGSLQSLPGRAESLARPLVSGFRAFPGTFSYVRFVCPNDYYARMLRPALKTSLHPLLHKEIDEWPCA